MSRYLTTTKNKISKLVYLDLSDCGKIFGTCVTNDSKESMKTRDILIMVFLIVTIVVCSCAGICCYLVKGKRRPRTTYFSEQRPSSSSISEQASSIFHVNLNTAFEKEISVAEGSNV